MVAPTYIVRTGFASATWGEIASTYSSWGQIAAGFSRWEELAAGPVPDRDVLEIITRREAATLFDRLKIGRATVRLDNSHGDYSPDRSGGPNSLQLNDALTVKALTDAGSLYGLFYGRVQDYAVEPGIGRSETRVTAVDGAEQLRRVINTDLEVDIAASSMASAVMTAVGIEGFNIAVSTGLTDIYPFSYLDEIGAGEALARIIESGNHMARVTGKGDIELLSRNFDLSRPVVASYDAFFGATYGISADGILNDVRLSGDPRKASQVTSIAELTGAPAIPGSASITFDLSFHDPDTSDAVPVQSFETLVSSQDWQLNRAEDGTGADVTATGSIAVTAFARSATFEIFNGQAFEAFVTKLVPRGSALLSRARFTSTKISSASQAMFGIRAFEVDNELIGSIDFADNYGEYLIARFKDPLARVGFSVANEFPGVIETELLDEVHVVNSHLGVASNFIVLSVAHAISFEAPGLRHTVSYGVRLSDTKDFFVLDISKLDIGKLGF